MANYAFPRLLFPLQEQIQHWATLGSTEPFLQDIRLRAATHSAFFASPDKELERFIHPACQWDSGIAHALEEKTSQHSDVQLDAAQQFTTVQELGGGAWIADFESMPTRPLELSLILEQLFLQPFSIAHYGLATATRFRVLYVPPGVTIEDRITITTDHTSLTYDAQIVCIIVGAGARITLDCTTSAERGIFTHVLLGWCAERASVNMINTTSYGSQAMGLTHEVWQTAFGSSLESLGCSSGGAQVWHKKEYRVGEAASVSHVSLSALRGAEQEVLITSQIHTGKESSSSIIVKSVLCDAARSFYRGTIVLNEVAQRAQAHQQQRALMLSAQARMCALPSLEVAVHTVRCSHGSAAGGFNDEQVQYLRTRGISREQAHDLLIEGFFSDGIGVQRDALKGIAQYLKGRCRSSLSQNAV